jgi:hypothetical protein
MPPMGQCPHYVDAQKLTAMYTPTVAPVLHAGPSPHAPVLTAPTSMPVSRLVRGRGR